MTLGALACNNLGQYLSGKSITESYRVHNKSFDPNFSLNGVEDRGMLSISSYIYPERGYDTYYAYTTNGNVPECRSQENNANITFQIRQGNADNRLALQAS